MPQTVTTKRSTQAPNLLSEATYIPCLDGLRGFSLLLVLACHNFGPLTYPIGAYFSGAYAVDMFFMISAYLITMVLMREKDKNGNFSLPRYYTRRMLRIFPAFYFFLAGTIALRLPLYGFHDLKPYGWAALYMSSISYSFKLNLVPYIYNLNHLWTLAIEEKFYAVWPLVLRKIGNYKSTTIIAFIAGFYAIKLAIVLSYLMLHPENFEIIQLFLLMDPILFGLCAAFIMRIDSCVAFLRKGFSGSSTQIFLAFACLAAAHIRTTTNPTVNAPCEFVFYWLAQYPLSLLLSITFLMAVLLEPRTIPGRVLSTRALTFLGIVSYGTYLWHETVHEMFGSYGSVFCLQHPYQAEILQYIASFAMGCASYYVVERPFLKLKEKFSDKDRPR